MIKRLIIFAIFLLIFVLFIAYARGYRLDVKKKSLTPTGIIAVTSNPRAAKIYVNGELKGATDMSLTLPPGSYSIDVKKDGYLDWKRTIVLKGELVMVADAYLFPQNSSLTPLTNLGVGKIVAIDQTDKLLLFSQMGQEDKDGIYVFDQSKKPFSLFPPLKLLILKKNLPAGVDLLTTAVTFSPDYKEGIFEFSGENIQSVAYDMGFDEEIKSPFDVTTSQESLKKAWDTERAKEAQKILEALPKLLQPIASDSFHIISFSPDKTKFLYEVNQNEVLPPVITPGLISANQEKEDRNLKTGSFYTYDIKEDKNFRLNIKDEEFADKKDAENSLANWKDNIESYVMWYPDSRHIVLNELNQISVMEFDNTNKQVIYSGPHEQRFLNVTTDGKLLVLVNLNPSINKSPDVYAVGVR